MRKAAIMRELLDMYERVEKANLQKGTKAIVQAYIRKLELQLIKILQEEKTDDQ